MSKPKGRNHRTDGPGGIPLTHTAMVLGDGRIMPIVETLGRRMIREIDPLSSDGRRLLADGRVALCWEDGLRFATRPVVDVLETLQSSARSRRDSGPAVPGWTVHHNRVIRSIGRMKRILRPTPRG